MIKAGRYTAAILLVVVGVSLLSDQMFDTDWIGGLMKWWPILLIALGLEYLVLSLINRTGEKRMKFDLGGIIAALIISGVVVGVTQAHKLSVDWFDDLPFNFSTFSDENGLKFDQGNTTVPLTAATEKIMLDNPNGAVILKSASIDHIVIHTTVYVSGESKDKAQTIAEHSKVAYNEGSTLELNAEGEEYRIHGFKRKPRMNLEITLPNDHAVDFEMKGKNGKVEASDLTLRSELRIETTNGEIRVSGIKGDVRAETTNGKVTASHVDGNVHLKTTNGSVAVTQIQGSAEIDTTNGSINGNNIKEDFHAKGTNGKISAVEVGGDVEADTTNGSITISSSKIGGDWDVDTTIGKITLAVPSDGDYKVKAEAGFGKAETDLPLNISKRRNITGTIGSGTYSIKVDTNQSVDIHAYKSSAGISR